jgi:hypothetical protein
MKTPTPAPAYIVVSVYHVGPFEEETRYTGPFPTENDAMAYMDSQPDDPDLMEMVALPMNHPDTGAAR